MSGNKVRGTWSINLKSRLTRLFDKTKTYQISPKDAYLNKSSYVIIDVRNEKEKTEDTGIIENSLHLPISADLSDHLNSLDPNQTYIFVSKHGQRSQGACQLGIKSGLKNVYNLKGGIEHWIEEGYPLSTLKTPTPELRVL